MWMCHGCGLPPEVLSITHASCRDEVAGTCSGRTVRATVGGGYESDRLCRDHVARLDHTRTGKKYGRGGWVSERSESEIMSCQAAIGRQITERKDKTFRGREVRMISTLRSGQ